MQVDLSKLEEEEAKSKDLSFLSTPRDEEDYLQASYDGTIKLGLSTGYEKLDHYFRFKEGNLVIVNGHDNVGKSTVIWYLAVISNLIHGWKWIFYTAENRDAAVRKRLIEFKYGRDYNKLNELELKEGKKWAYANFAIIKGDTLETYDSLKDKAELLIETVKEKKKTTFKGLLIDPYNALDVDLTDPKFKGLSTHDFHYKATSAFRVFKKKFNCAVYINCHAITGALRSLDKEGFPIPPNKADTEGGGKFSNRADEFITLHRLTQHPFESNYTQLHVRKVKEYETGGKPTPLNEPIFLILDNRDGWFGFYDEDGKCVLKDIYQDRNNIKQEVIPEEVLSNPNAGFEDNSFETPKFPTKEQTDEFGQLKDIKNIPF